MILLVTAMERREECASALREVMGEAVVVATDLLNATTRLREQSWTIAVFDEQCWLEESDALDTAVAHLGAAIPVVVNFAISGCDRVVREVRAAVRRRKIEEASARVAAQRSLRAELGEAVTTLLMESELALQTSDMAPDAMEHLTSVHDAAAKLSTRLDQAHRDL